MVDEQDERLPASGDLDGFEHLVGRHQQALRSWLLVRTPSDVDIDDLVQQTFLTAYERMHGFRRDSSVRTWLIGIAHNCLRQALRSRRRRSSVPLGLAARLVDEQALTHSRDSAQSLQALRSCLQELGPPFARMIDAHYREGQPLATIAETEGRPTGTIKRRLYEARRLLADCVRRRLGEGET